MNKWINLHIDCRRPISINLHEIELEQRQSNTKAQLQIPFSFTVSWRYVFWSSGISIKMQIPSRDDVSSSIQTEIDEEMKRKRKRKKKKFPNWKWKQKKMIFENFFPKKNTKTKDRWTLTRAIAVQVRRVILRGLICVFTALRNLSELQSCKQSTWICLFTFTVPKSRRF